jgi:hypothetical protein
MAEEKHLALAAKIQWARYARSQIRALAREQADARVHEPLDASTLMRDRARGSAA